MRQLRTVPVLRAGVARVLISLLCLSPALLALACGGGGGPNPLRGSARIPAPQQEDLLLTADSGLAEAELPQGSFEFPVTVELTTSEPGGETGPEGEELLRVAELRVTDVHPPEDEADDDEEEPELPAPEEIAMQASATLRFRLDRSFPPDVQLPVFRWSELNRRFIDAGLSAQQVEEGEFAEVTVTEQGRYALGLPPPEQLPPDPPGSPEIVTRATGRAGLRWEQPPAGQGVNVYRGNIAGESFTQLNEAPLTDTVFFDQLDGTGGVSYRLTRQWLPDGPESEPGPVAESPAVTPDLVFQLGRGSLNFEGELFPAVAPGPAFWVAAPEENRIYRFNLRGELEEIMEPGLSLPFPRVGPLVQNRFDRGWYLTQYQGARVFLGRSDLSPILSFGGEGDGDGNFRSITGIALTSNSVVVGDGQRDVLQEFTPNGVFKRNFGNSSDPAMAVSGPRQIVPSGEGGVLVADRGNDRVVEFDEELAFSAAIEPDGPGGAPLLQDPIGLAREDGGELWISSPGTSRLVHLDANGELIEQFGAPGSATGEFHETGPGYLAFDPETGYLLIADPGNGKVLVFRT